MKNNAARICFYISLVLGILGWFRCPCPGEDILYFFLAVIFAIASIIILKGSYRTISLAMILLFSAMSFLGYSRDRAFRQWLKENPPISPIRELVEHIRSTEPVIVAHRGASGHAPENTIPAFNLAWQQGADAIEADFHLTQDGHIVCIHDDNTESVAGTNLFIKKATLDQLRNLDVGAYYGKEYTGTTIPVIAEVLATVPEQKKIYIEIKCGAPIIPKLLDEIAKSQLNHDQIIAISFDREVIRKLKTEAPLLKTFWLVSIKRNMFGKIAPSLESVLKTLKESRADGLSSCNDYINENFIRNVLAQEYEFHVWGVNDLETAMRFKQWGAMSITTDLPAFIKKNLARKTSPTDTDKP
jgi:glycerophosphoryl diester phosphodiesterase